MSPATGHCELCDLPLAYCPHGRPAPEPAPRSSAPPAQGTSSASRTSAGAPGTGKRHRSSRKQSGVSTRSVGRRRSSPEEFRPVILRVLQQYDRQLDAEEMFTALRERVGDDLRTGDHETTPTGEPQWQYAARRARQTLISEGLLVHGSGVWGLTDAGRSA